MINKATLKFVAKNGVQKPFKTVEPSEEWYLESNLEGGAFEQSGQTLTTIQINEEKLELRVCRKIGTICELK